MENLKYLILEDEDVELTEEDHAYLIFLGTICLESLHRNGLYKDVDDEELIFDMEDANWEILETPMATWMNLCPLSAKISRKDSGFPGLFHFAGLR
jgi:hypothetical protein